MAGRWHGSYCDGPGDAPGGRRRSRGRRTTALDQHEEDSDTLATLVRPEAGGRSWSLSIHPKALPWPTAISR